MSEHGLKGKRGGGNEGNRGERKGPENTLENSDLSIPVIQVLFSGLSIITVWFLFTWAGITDFDYRYHYRF